MNEHFVLHIVIVLCQMFILFEINETFYTMTKGTIDQPNSFGDTERYAQHWNHSDYWRTRVKFVFQIWHEIQMW